MPTGTDSHYPVALLYYNWHQQKQIWLSSKVWIWFRPSVPNYLRGWSHIFLGPWKPAELCRDQQTGKRSCGVLSREDSQAAAVSCIARCSMSGLLYITLSVGPEGAPYLDKKLSVPSRKKGPKQSGCRQTESKQGSCSLQPQQILFKNSAEVLRQQDSNRNGNEPSGSTTARVLCEWMNVYEGWEDEGTAFLQRLQFL